MKSIAKTKVNCSKEKKIENKVSKEKKNEIMEKIIAKNQRAQ
jgi:hypothetical protein